MYQLLRDSISGGKQITMFSYINFPPTSHHLPTWKYTVRRFTGARKWYEFWPFNKLSHVHTVNIIFEYKSISLELFSTATNFKTNKPSNYYRTGWKLYTKRNTTVFVLKNIIIDSLLVFILRNLTRRQIRSRTTRFWKTIISLTLIP